ncbi:MAG: tetratricopeptide repeat protein [Candidatus Thorarchaeota archaeon]
MYDIANDETASLFRRGERFKRFGELDAAEEALRAVVDADPTHHQAWNLLGLVYQDSEAFGEAMECFERATELVQKWIEPVENLGMLYYSQGLFEQAVKTLGDYLKLGGTEVDALLALAKSAAQMDDCRTVLSVTSSILDVADDLFEVWEMRGVCQARLERYNAACTSLSVAIDLNPRTLNSINVVGDLCYEAENYLRAAEFYQSSLSVKRNQPYVLFRFGTSLWFLGRWAEAIECLEKYTALVSEDPRGWNNLGVALREKGDRMRAMECYKEALAIDHGLDIVRQNLEADRRMQVML